MKQFLLGGLLPVLAYVAIEAIYGTVAGLIAGIVLGIGEMVYEYVTLKKVQGITIISNLLVIVLGGVSLFESDPTFFKLQPAILCFAFAGFLLISSWMGKPMLVEMMRKQRPDAPPEAFELVGKMNFRVGLMMIVIGIVGVHAAYHWSTAAWATYKGVGVPALLLVYMLIEVVIVRLRRNRRPPPEV